MSYAAARIEDLEALYGAPVAAATKKVTARLTGPYRDWIEAARFCILATVGPEGTDASPRGDDGPVVRALDAETLALPDWHGNNRIDSLRNIARDGRVSLTFMVPGSENVVRVNGTAIVTLDEDLAARFERDGKRPRSVIVVTTREVYFQCARAIRRSGLWGDTAAPSGLPSAGDMLAAASDGEVGGPAYDASWPKRAEASMW
ncbi:pyridoxamine 5'-phosphate oxidase family protein [Tropicimonas sp. IMCC34011]|uniref:pyridoxamine 5'-phosphate oxidase family protein n=1 Tax=Tropicimonas sp. IMCC34011 TaxID=2248759 RepID=UPI000E249781|nr:pyridoxamine 5'-phosphate oxidase family protein [Tropicimonas sp. IMCC34011]